MEIETKSNFDLANALTSLEENINGRLNLVHVLLISFIPTVLSILYQNGGLAFIEIYNYLPEYLSGKPLLAILYNSKILDMDKYYQARELSYFFDYIDAKFIEFSVRHGHPHFLSITTYLFLLGIGLLIWQFSVKTIKLPPLTGLAIVILYWTSPSVFLAGSYYRSSKNGEALTGAILFILLYKFFSLDDTSPKKYISKTTWLLFFSVSWAGTLFDRQGLYFIGMIILFIFSWNILFPHKSNLLLLSAFGASLIMSFAYNDWISPFLTEYFNHYQPNFLYQKMPWADLVHDPLAYIAAGVILYVDTVRFMFGNLPSPVATIGLLAIIFEIVRRFIQNRKTGDPISKADAASIGLIFSNVFLFMGLNALMVLRHPPVLWYDVRRVYYWLPQVVILSLTLAMLVSGLKDTYKNVVFLLLILAIAGNMIAIPQHKAYLTHWHLKPYFEFTPKLLEALANLNNPEYHATLGVIQNHIYQHFHKSLIP